MDGGALTDSLLTAGAQQIVCSDAHVFTASLDSQVVRGERRVAQGTRRTRLEITTGPDHVAGVVAALRENAGRPVEVSVHVAEGTP